MRTSKRRYNTTGLKSEIFEGLAETSDRRLLPLILKKQRLFLSFLPVI